MSCSSFLRLALVIACVAGLSAAQGGTFKTCPTVSSSLDYFAPSNCSAYNTCAAARCTCNGGTYTTSTQLCGSPTSKTCTAAQPCEAAFIQCMQTAAATSSCLTSLKIALMNIVAGISYNGSAVYTACTVDTCRNFNQTTTSNCTTLPYSAVCFLATSAPTTTTSNSSSNTSTTTTIQLYVGKMTLGGTYTAIIANATALGLFSLAVSSDLTAKLQVTCTVTSIVSGSAIVTFTANVAANNATFLAAVTAAAANGNWLTKTSAAFTALGGTGTFGLLGIASNGGTPAPTTVAPGSRAGAIAFAWALLVAVALAIFA
jgi:hypothetical protein